MQKIILLFWDMSKLKKRNRITIQDLKFIEAKTMSSGIMMFFGHSTRLSWQPIRFFPFGSSDGGNRKDVSYVVESFFWSSLVTESGTPRTITCQKVESFQF